MGEPKPASDELVAQLNAMLEGRLPPYPSPGGMRARQEWIMPVTEVAAVLARLSAVEAELASLRAGFGPEQADEFTEAINAAHPVASGNHEHMALAERMVHVRQSKWSLVRLVNWLLCQRADAEAERNKALERTRELEGYMAWLKRAEIKWDPNRCSPDPSATGR